MPTFSQTPAPAEAPKNNFLQRAQFLHLARDLFDVMDMLHTAPYFNAAMIGAIRGYMQLSFTNAALYTIPLDYTEAQACAQPFRAILSLAKQIDQLTLNHTLSAEDICGIIYTRTAEILSALFPSSYQRWLDE